MPEMLGMDRLKSKLAFVQGGVARRYQYYDMHMALQGANRDLPRDLAVLRSVLGWCGKAVDSLADRIVFRSFSDDALDMGAIYEGNNSDILFDSAILAAMIGSCSFVYIAPDVDGSPRMRVLDGMNATGVIDPVTYMLSEGYAVLERDSNFNVLLEAYLLPYETHYYPKDRPPYVVKHASPYPLLVPVIYRPDATRAFGHSRITRACMDLTQAAMRTVRRADIASEFYSYPQRYVIGMNEDAEEGFDKWKAAMSAFMRIDKDEDNDRPVVGQFQQQSMTPFNDQIRMLGGLFAGETGLTLDDLGMPSANPSSSDAIKASHETLRLMARKAQRTFSTGFVNAGYLAACLRDNYDYQRRQISQTHVKWEPIFEPDASQIGAIGDAIIKIQQAFPDYFDAEKLRDLTGI